MIQPASLVDSYGRTIRDLRISLTDRCNFRCVYCLPETDQAADFYRTRAHSGTQGTAPVKLPLPPWKPRSELLTFEEIERLVKLSAAMGIQKIRLTGGEPLLRKNLEELIVRLARIPGITDLALTTNGFLFPEKAVALRQAGLHRVTFSLDSLRPETFKKMTGCDGLGKVLESIRLAHQLGFTPVKVNAVIIRDLNDNEIGDLAEFAIRERVHFRFIEFMPLDSSRAWLRDMVVPGREILDRLRSRFELSPVTSSNRSETAKRWSLPGGTAEVGVIAPVTEPFCGHCNRIRLTADGKIRTCLFSLHEHDLKGLLREQAPDERLRTELARIVLGKEARHHIGEADFVQPARTMSCIGG